MQAHRVGGARSPSRAARAALLSALLFLSLVAHAPWIRAGLSIGDYAARLAAAIPGPTAAWQRLQPLPLPGEPALAARLEALLCLLIFAGGMASFLRRSLAPWAGEERARNVGLLMAAFFLLHPLLVEGGAPEALRGARLALALAGLSGALFLAGRQEGQEARTAAAVGLFLCAGFFSGAAAPMCLVFPFVEYVSSHRHRPRGLRARTALVTGLVFVGATLVPRFVIEEELGAPDSLRAFTLDGVEALGRLCIPAPESAGVLGVLACGAALLLAFQPLFRAAQQAPRLWGGLCAGWSASLALSLAWWSMAEAPEVRSGRAMFALAVLCAGLALTASALSTERARWVALAVALCFTPVAHANARGVLLAGEAAAAEHRFLGAHVPAGDTRVFVLEEEPPATGGDSTQQPGWLLHPALTGGSQPPGGPPFDPERVRAIRPRGLAVLLRSPLAARVCPAGTGILFRDGTLRTRAASTADSRVSPPAPWREALGVSFEDGLDPLDLEGLEVVAELATQPGELEVLGWRARDGGEGEVSGTVREQRGRRLARYDLSSSLDWLLAGEVRSLLLPRGRRAIERAEFLARLPEPEGFVEPIPAGRDWLFRGRTPEGSEPLLTLLRTHDLASTSRTLTPEPSGLLRARDLASFLAPTRTQGEEIAWALEFLAEGRVLARSSGVWKALP